MTCILTLLATACQQPQPDTSPQVSSTGVTPTPTPGQDLPEPAVVPPGPVLAIAPLPEGDFLVGVGPVGDVETGYQWQVFRGKDSDWQPLPWPPEAVPRSFHVSPTGNEIFTVPFSNAVYGRGQAWGLMRSDDGGHSWRQALEGLGDPYVMDLAFSPAFVSDRTVFAITWYNGVYFSTDGGENWQPSPYQETLQPSGGPGPYDLTVAVSPTYQHATDTQGSTQGLVIASFSRGLHRWRATNTGWQTVPMTVTCTLDDYEPPEAQLTAGAVAFSPDFTVDDTLFLYSAYAGLLRSTDGGETWQSIQRRLPSISPLTSRFQLAAASADEAYVLLPTPDKGDEEELIETFTLFRTLDGGRTWQALTGSPAQGGVSAFALSHDTQGQVILHLGGRLGGVSSHLADTLMWD